MWDVDWKSLAIGAAAVVSAKVAYEVAVAAAKNRCPTDSSPRGLRVVLTGGSLGLGRALAKEFLSMGDSVVIMSRDPGAGRGAAVDLANAGSAGAGQGARVSWVQCDVRDAQQVDAAAQEAAKKLGGIDIWINNAGVSMAPKSPLSTSDPEKLAAVVETNLLGAMYGARSAARIMAAQPADRRYKIIFMDGAGADGSATPNNAAYGASKHGLVQLVRSAGKELSGRARKAPGQENEVAGNVEAHLFSPGMVLTDLLLSGADLSSPMTARALNLLAEPADVVARWMAPRIRGVRGSSPRHVRYLTPLGVLGRFATFWRYSDRWIAKGKLKRV
ncbi:unnamed protein product [Pedinophyceae sp. YPF-701]|nr:unnamed protein product [Pedinophyceae sp. YPF-701]